MINLAALSFLDVVCDDLARVEALLLEHPHGRHEAIRWAVELIAGSGGKRLRPALVLLSSHLCGADIDRAIFMAAAVEMLHTATLIHDDLIDDALMRRGVETLNARPHPWTPAATVLTGDYFFAYAANLASQAINVKLMQRFSQALMTICDGEMRQMFDFDKDGQSITIQGSAAALAQARDEYERRIYAKTASLIALSAEAGAVLAQLDDCADSPSAAALHTYGRELGIAFQIVDDVLDFTADEETLGKPVGSDLRHGLLTLPVLFFLEARPDDPVVGQVLRGDRSEAMIREAVRLVVDSPAIERTTGIAQRHAQQAKEALDALPALECSRVPYLKALLDLADFTVRRCF